MAKYTPSFIDLTECQNPTAHVSAGLKRIVVPPTKAAESTVRAMDDLRYGVIGTGMMGIEHIETLHAIPGCSVTAVADPNPESLARGSTAAGTSRAHHDHRKLLDAGGCDAIVIASPNMTHIDVLRDVLATDLPVLVEKPLCTTLDDCREVVDLAVARDAMVWVGLEYRYMPPVAKLLQSVGAGAVGNVQMVAIREHRFPFLKKVGDWNRFNRNTGGTLVEKCCHFFDLMSLIARGAPLRVFASGSQDVNHLDESYGGEPSDILDNAYVVVDYDNGVRAMLDLCMFADATHNQEELAVVGDTGKVEALIPEDVLRTGRRGEHWIGGVHEEPVIDETITYAGLHRGSSFVQHQRFAAAVRSGSGPEVSVHDGLLSVAVGVAAHRSIEEQRVVSMSEIV